jgi:dihydropteroate synthase
MQKNNFCTNFSLNLKGKILSIDKPLVMGILNITENSFFDGNTYTTDNEILKTG